MGIHSCFQLCFVSLLTDFREVFVMLHAVVSAQTYDPHKLARARVFSVHRKRSYDSGAGDTSTNTDKHKAAETVHVADC